MIHNPEQLPELNIWLVHDWLTGLRGGEKVLAQLVALFPNSRIATLLHVPGATDPALDQRVAQTSFLQKFPRAPTAYRNFLPLFPAAIRSLKLQGPCDLVISSSHAVAKNVLIPKGVPHLCYCHTPMRYIWGLEDQYLPKRSLKRLALRALRGFLQRADLRGTPSVTRFLANSATVANRIQRIYHRDATVVHPGIDETFWIPSPEPATGDYFLAVSALVPYKRIDLAIEAARLTGQRLLIVGTGPDQAPLRRRALGLRNVEFLGHLPDLQIRTLYQACIALVFPGEEDFGLTPLEAMACARPVVAFGSGGVTETVTSQTGLFFHPQTPAALAQAMQAAQRATWDAPTIRRRALEFTWTTFRQAITREVLALLPR